MTTTPAAVAVGHVTWDINDGGAVTAGGSVTFAASAWAAWGLAPGVITAAAEPGPVAALAQVRCAASRATTAFRNDYGAGGQRRQVLTAQAAPVPVEALPAAWGAPAVLCLCPVLGEVSAPAWLARPAGLKALGLQGWLKRAAVGGPVDHGPAGVDPQQFAGADLACLSGEDLAGDLAWLDALRRVVPRVALTDGPRGAWLFDGPSIQRVGVAPAEAVDPTGAGDSFLAGLAAALAQGADFGAAAAWGAAAAAVVIEHRGLAPAAALQGTAARAAQVSRPAGPAAHASSPCGDPAR